MVALVLLLLASSLRAQDPAEPTWRMEASYFEGAPRALRRQVLGVLELAVGRPSDPVPAGLTRIDLRRRPDPRAPVVRSCQDPLSAGRVPEEALCGWRFLGALRSPTGARILLPVTQSRPLAQARWHEVVTDPEADARGWIEEGPQTRYLPLRTWFASARRLVRTTAVSHSADILRSSPRDGAVLVELRDIGPPVLLYRGIDGDWVRVRLEGPRCRRLEEDEEPGRGARPPCPTGWLRWRGPDGTLYLLPEPGVTS